VKVKLTKKVVDKAQPGPERWYLWDTEYVGFGLVVHPSGQKVFVLRYRGPLGRRRATVGRYGALTVEKAREKARDMAATVVKGGDPLADEAAQRAVPTFAEWVTTYLDIVKQRKKTHRDDRRYLGLAKERWGKKRLNRISTDDVVRAFEHQQRKVGEGRDQRGGRISANRFLASVRACLQEAWRRELVTENVAARVQFLPENPPRSRVLNEDELRAVIEALEGLKDEHERAAFELLITTGARKSEVLAARWEDLDLDEGLWRLPSPKAGNPQVIPLPKRTVALLRRLPHLGPWVIPGRDPAKPRSELRNVWTRIREAAGVEDVTVHDLRRTFGLHVARTAGLHVASRLLRHSTVKMTEKVYAPLGIDELRKATEKADRGRGKVLKLDAAARRRRSG